VGFLSQPAGYPAISLIVMSPRNLSHGGLSLPLRPRRRSGVSLVFRNLRQMKAYTLFPDKIDDLPVSTAFLLPLGSIGTIYFVTTRQQIT